MNINSCNIDTRIVISPGLLTPSSYAEAWKREILRRALAAYYRRPEASQHCRHASRVIKGGKKYYARICDSEGVLAVYRFRPNSNSLIKVDRWPKSVNPPPKRMHPWLARLIRRAEDSKAA